MSITRGVLLVLEARAREYGVTTDELITAMLAIDSRTLCLQLCTGEDQQHTNRGAYANNGRSAKDDR